MNDLFEKAWREFIKNDYEIVVSFHHNGCQIIITPDNAKYMRYENPIKEVNQ